MITPCLQYQVNHVLTAAGVIFAAVLGTLYSHGIRPVCPPSEERAARLSWPNICRMIHGFMRIEFIPFSVEGNIILERGPVATGQVTGITNMRPIISTIPGVCITFGAHPSGQVSNG